MCQWVSRSNSPTVVLIFAIYLGWLRGTRVHEQLSVKVAEWIGTIHLDTPARYILMALCPDGDVPNYELLFYDHLYSLGRNALETLCARSKLAVLRTQKAPTTLGPFQIMVARPMRDGEQPQPAIEPEDDHIVAAKDDYLVTWSRLEGILGERIGGATSIVVFGNGDVAALLRVYAPAVFALAAACVIDGEPTVDCFFDLPLRSYSSLRSPRVIVLGIRPGNQDGVARRLNADGHRVVRWDDVVPA